MPAPPPAFSSVSTIGTQGALQLDVPRRAVCQLALVHHEAACSWAAWHDKHLLGQKRQHYYLNGLTVSHNMLQTRANDFCCLHRVITLA